MPKYIATQGDDFVIEHLDRGFGGGRTESLKVDGTTGAVSLQGKELTGAQTIAGDLEVTGDIAVDNLDVTTDATVGGNLDVTGDVSADNLDVTTDAAVGGDLAVTGNTELATADVSGDVTLAAGADLVLDSAGAGSKVGTAANQKLGFWGVTPVVQHSSTGELTGFTAGSGTPVLDDSTFTGDTGDIAYTIGDVVKALKLAGILKTSA